MHLGLRGKLLVAVVVSLVLVDSLAYAVARRQFGETEMESAHDRAGELAAAMAARADQQVSEWAALTRQHLGEVDDLGEAVAVAELRGHGMEGATFTPSGHDIPTQVSYNSHETDEVDVLLEATRRAPEGASLAHEHVLLVVLDARGRMVSWNALDDLAKVLVADTSVGFVDPAEPHALDGEATHVERAALTTLPLDVALAVNGSAAVAAADALAQRFLLTNTLALAASGLAAVLIVGRTLSPLRRITDAARRLGRPGSSPIKLHLRSGDEMQVLAETLESSSVALAKGREKEREQADALRRAAVDQTRLDAAVALEKRDEDHRRVLDALTEPLVVVDRAGDVLLANAAARLQGVRVGDHVSRALEHGAGELGERILNASLAACPPVRVETRSHRLLDVEARSVTFDDGDAVLLVATDVTERVRLAQEAEERRAALARAERLSSLGTLVAGVAHEINNPLTYINGNIELALYDLEHIAGTEDTRAQLKRALAGTERIAHITQSLRAVARQQPRAEPEDVDLAIVVRNVEALLRVGLPPNVDVEVQTSSAPAHVKGSSTELHQVVLNLAKNAVEALGERGGRVRLRCLPLDQEAHLLVEDDGPGLPTELAEKLFTPFFTTKPGGTGLGLSIAQGIVRDHGGRIELHSAPGKGATFRVILPLLRAPSARAVLPSRP